MKKFVLTILLTTIGFSTLHAQNLEIVEKKILIEKTPVDALVMAIGEEYTFSKKTFKAYVKDALDVKMGNDGKSALLAQKVNVPTLSSKKGDLKATYFTDRDSAYLGVSFILGYEIFINSENYPEEMKKLREFVRGYQEYHFTSFHNNQIADQENQKKKLLKEIKTTERAIGKLRKRIGNNDKKMSKSDDTAKKLIWNSKNANHHNEISKLNKTMLGLNEEVIHAEFKMAELKNALSAFLIKIKEAQRLDLITQFESQ